MMGLDPCKKCGGKMRKGVALQQTVNRLRPDQRYGTLYPSGPGTLIVCLKCTACGWSILREPV